jgi:hypothetical protein
LVVEARELLALLSEDGALESFEIGVEPRDIPFEPLGPFPPLAVVRLPDRLYRSGEIKS